MKINFKPEFAALFLLANLIGPLVALIFSETYGALSAFMLTLLILILMYQALTIAMFVLALTMPKRMNKPKIIYSYIKFISFMIKTLTFKTASATDVEWVKYCRVCGSEVRAKDEIHIQDLKRDKIIDSMHGIAGYGDVFECPQLHQSTFEELWDKVPCYTKEIHSRRNY